MTRWLAFGAAIIASFLAAAVILLLMYEAAAQEHHHPTGPISGEAAKFYERWDRIDMPGSSCCSQKDCYAAPARMVRGTWFFLRREDQRWVPVPSAKIETRFDSPDGLAHVCATPPDPQGGGTVFCFLPAGGA